jgi:hypothetical protein
VKYAAGPGHVEEEEEDDEEDEELLEEEEPSLEIGQVK